MSSERVKNLSDDELRAAALTIQHSANRERHHILKSPARRDGRVVARLTLDLSTAKSQTYHTIGNRLRSLASLLGAYAPEIYLTKEANCLTADIVDVDIHGDEVTTAPFSMTFDLGPASCQICGKTDGCEHLQANLNGVAFSPGALRSAMEKFVGQPVTSLLREHLSDDIARQLPDGALTEELEVKEVKQVGDRLITTVGPKVNSSGYDVTIAPAEGDIELEYVGLDDLSSHELSEILIPRADVVSAESHRRRRALEILLRRANGKTTVKPQEDHINGIILHTAGGLTIHIADDRVVSYNNHGVNKTPRTDE